MGDLDSRVTRHRCHVPVGTCAGGMASSRRRSRWYPFLEAFHNRGAVRVETSSQKPAPTLVLSAGDEIAPVKVLEPGTLVSNRYRVVGLLGQGAMGAVYRVEHVHMHKAFALKVLHEN